MKRKAFLQTAFTLTAALLLLAGLAKHRLGHGWCARQWQRGDRLKEL